MRRESRQARTQSQHTHTQSHILFSQHTLAHTHTLAARYVVRVGHINIFQPPARGTLHTCEGPAKMRIWRAGAGANEPRRQNQPARPLPGVANEDVAALPAQAEQPPPHTQTHAHTLARTVGTSTRPSAREGKGKTQQTVKHSRGAVGRGRAATATEAEAAAAPRLSEWQDVAACRWGKGGKGEGWKGSGRTIRFMTTVDRGWTRWCVCLWRGWLQLCLIFGIDFSWGWRHSLRPRPRPPTSVLLRPTLLSAHALPVHVPFRRGNNDNDNVPCGAKGRANGRAKAAAAAAATPARTGTRMRRRSRRRRSNDGLGRKATTVL